MTLVLPLSSVAEAQVLPVLEKMGKDDDMDVKYFSDEALAAINEHFNAMKQ